ncbi:hypothetical protein FACHB389_01340 [Nostoc calcicola FACHB-389]|nr:hypothetical protein FACHB389_01340 [Nostoc calcicola FACHB-389]
MNLNQREFDKPHPPNLPLLKGEGGARKIKVLLPSPRRRGVGGEVKTVLIELTLNQVKVVRSPKGLSKTSPLAVQGVSKTETVLLKLIFASFFSKSKFCL